MADETPTTVEEVLPEGTATGTGFDTPTQLSQALTSRMGYSRRYHTFCTS